MGKLTDILRENSKQPKNRKPQADPKAAYFELLKDPRWQKMRLEIMERDDWCCQLCYDSEATLNVHHAFYEWGRSPWEYNTATLHTVCESCHERANDLRRDLQFQAAKLRMEQQGQLLGLLAVIESSSLTHGDVLVLIDRWAADVREQSSVRDHQRDGAT